VTGTVAIVLLAIVEVAGLLIVPLGLPGLWVMMLGLLSYGWFTDFQTVGLWTTTLVLGLALLGELIETWLGFRFARKYGASKRAAWGALIGGLVGAVVGVPVPVIGSVIGAFVGSFAGAAIFEYTMSAHTGTAVAAGWGAVLGRAAAAAAKIALGIVIGVISAIAVVRHIAGTV
jgi:uncharacterized protein YqgC (DUF456 family)